MQSADLLLCTEPLVGCLMLKGIAAERRGYSMPLLGYLGVALLNNCPPEDVKRFWAAFESDVVDEPSTVLAVNNLILSEQVFYQTGFRLPYIRAHGLYTKVSYAPSKPAALFWRAPLFSYQTFRCAVGQFMAEFNGKYPLEIEFMDDGSIAYEDIVKFRSVVLVPWDHALMTFYEMYSMGIPIFLPQRTWMYRFLYQRGQLSVGERLYQAIRPGHIPPYAKFRDNSTEQPMEPKEGLSTAKAARGVAEDMLNRALEADSWEGTKTYSKLALELIQDMRYFHAVAENKTTEDTYTSMGVVRRQSSHSAADNAVPEGDATDESWHPYTPYQMATADGNDYTRKRKGGWWVRRGVRFDAMRYWFDYSDFARLPGLQYFASIQDLMCKLLDADLPKISAEMREYNRKTLVESSAFWLKSVSDLLGWRQ
mmetsp:Transcript_44922/g.101686  ORF Transcript_44922/g.101686 Transcript_44922/m.101686 type:complete len:424 (+) Transcript_44922:945-2216(+)